MTTTEIREKITAKERELISRYPMRRQQGIVREKLLEFIREHDGIAK